MLGAIRGIDKEGIKRKHIQVKRTLIPGKYTRGVTVTSDPAISPLFYQPWDFIRPAWKIRVISPL